MIELDPALRGRRDQGVRRFQDLDLRVHQFEYPVARRAHLLEGEIDLAQQDERFEHLVHVAQEGDERRQTQPAGDDGGRADPDDGHEGAEGEEVHRRTVGARQTSEAHPGLGDGEGTIAEGVRLVLLHHETLHNPQAGDDLERLGRQFRDRLADPPGGLLDSLLEQVHDDDHDGRERGHEEGEVEVDDE